MELQLALALPLPTNYLHLNSNNLPFHKKRTFDHAQETTHTNPILPTLSLLPLTPSHHTHPSSNIPKNDDEALVGWPPLNYSRKKPRFHHSGDEVADNDHMVKMEGVGIARKVDLSMYQSFHTLKDALMDMFGKCHQLSNTYKLAYQDKEGDWLLAEDVPWRSFVRSARRLKLLKSSG